MIYVFIFIFLILFLVFAPFRYFVFHPFKVISYAFKDFYLYFKHKKYNNFKSGSFNAYDSYSSLVFGSGKTLSCVHQVISDYNRYNDKLVWSEQKNIFIPQKIHIKT